jgi:hypothetical protein
MKALTVIQPWASLLVWGVKIFETRSWRTSHTGPLLIHAGVKRTAPIEALLNTTSFRELIAGRELVRGCIIGEVYLTGCFPTTDVSLTDPERELGDFAPGRWAWSVATPICYRTPIPFSGMRALFDVEDEAILSIIRKEGELDFERRKSVYRA